MKSKDLGASVKLGLCTATKRLITFLFLFLLLSGCARQSPVASATESYSTLGDDFTLEFDRLFLSDEPLRYQDNVAFLEAIRLEDLSFIERDVVRSKLKMFLSIENQDRKYAPDSQHTGVASEIAFLRLQAVQLLAQVGTWEDVEFIQALLSHPDGEHPLFEDECMKAIEKLNVDFNSTPSTASIVPHEARWGIYRLDLESQEVVLLFSSPDRISFLRLNHCGDRLAFSQAVGGDDYEREEIFVIHTDGSNLSRLTDNDLWDLYPAWSPGDDKIAFLTQRDGSLGIFTMNVDGSAPEVLFDTMSHEADIDWVGDYIAFTKDSQIWIMQSDGSMAQPLTDPPRAGEWGAANLPFGDYDPRISPDGSKVVFERLVGDESVHGNYDLFSMDLETLQETRLTSSGYSQGLASWSHSGQQLVYIVSAIDGAGHYDMYIMDTDGTNNRNITPDTFPPEFLCHWGIFSVDDSAIYFIGEWWSDS
jgi:hypothetical protein